MVNTKPLGNQTIPYTETEEFQLEQDVLFQGQKNEYLIKAAEYVSKGGEAMIYHCYQDNEQFIAKIYTQSKDTPASRKSRKELYEFLSSNECHHLMPLIDYGMVTIIQEEEEFKYPVEILPVCKNIASKYTEARLKKVIIPALIEAMNYLHSHGYVHRDIKPENIFIYHRAVVLGDFGCITRMIEVLDSNLSKLSVVPRQTPGYTAPEIANHFALAASDYFSFGCTIASLFHGQHVYQNLIDEGQNYELQTLIMTQGLPLSDSSEPLQKLVNACVQFDPKSRPGYKEVIQWLKDGKIKTATFHKNAEFDFEFEGKHYSDLVGIAMGFVNNWEKAKQYVFRGGRDSIFCNFLLKSSQNKVLNDIYDVIDGTRNFDLGLAKVITILQDGGAIYWKCNKGFEKLSDLADQNSTWLANLLASTFLSWRLARMNKDTSMMKTIEATAVNYPNIAIIAFQYSVGKKNRYTSLMMDTIALNNVNVPFNEELLGYFVYRGYRQGVEHYLTDLAKNRNNRTLEYLFMEAIVSDKAKLHQLYITQGPYSDLTWFKKNIGGYICKTESAKSLQRNIENLSFSSNLTIHQLEMNYGELMEYQRDFLSRFHNDPYLAQLGLDATSEVTSYQLELYFQSGMKEGRQICNGYAQERRK